MFEEYLEDANYFAEEAAASNKSRSAKRYYRASVFCALSAVESFSNYIGNALSQSGMLKPFEIALLTDEKFELIKGEFRLIEKTRYHRIEDKLRFLLRKFVPNFDFEKDPCWSRFMEFKRFRDSITHPRQEEDNIELKEYRKQIEFGISSIIEMMNYLCKGVFDKPLRQHLLDLRVDASQG